MKDEPNIVLTDETRIIIEAYLAKRKKKVSKRIVDKTKATYTYNFKALNKNM